MKVKILIIGMVTCVVFIAILIIMILLVNFKKEPGVNEIVPKSTVEKIEEPLVVFLDEEENEQNEEGTMPVHVKDAAELTQEIYNINGPIGVLYIPKTGLNTQIFSRVNANKMEEMPCFLYTTGGLNEVGTTIFVGHNRGNGLLFSDNKLIEENDEIYFNDLNGVEKKYKVYSKFVTTNDDVSFYNSNVDSPVIAMQCCLTPSDEKNVLIILAKAEN